MITQFGSPALSLHLSLIDLSPNFNYPLRVGVVLENEFGTGESG
jgi:hypothetical protein